MRRRNTSFTDPERSAGFVDAMVDVEDLSLVGTHCPYCALQCGMTLQVRRAEQGQAMVTVTPRDFPTNRGNLCRKGWTCAELLSSPERLTVPLVRRSRSEDLVATSWEEAIDRTVTALTALQERYGPDSIGVLGGGGLTNEKAYLLGKFARVALRTRMIDYNGRFCMAAAATATRRAFGVDRGLPFPLSDIERTDLLILVGVNTAETMPVLLGHIERMRAAGGRLVVIDPRRSATAELADIFVQSTPGADIALAQGLLRLVIDAGLVDEAFVAARTRGFDEVRAHAMGFWPERVEALTGVSIVQLRAVVEELRRAQTTILLTGRGVEQHVTGTHAVLAYINLMLALGRVGRPWCGYGSVTGQGNGQGGREHGQKADQLPGYRSITDPCDREHVARVWGVDPEQIPGPGVPATEILTKAGTEDGVRGLLVFGCNPAVSAPEATRVENRLRSLDFLAVADFVLSETAALADVVFPVTQWAEETGTMTNLEGRVVVRRKALDPPPGVRSDLEVLAMLATALECRSAFPSDPAAVFAELRRASSGAVADYAGIDYERIVTEDGVFWPCPSADHPGTPRLFLDCFPTPDGRARFHVVPSSSADEAPDVEFPLCLTTGRLLEHYQSGAQTRRIDPLRRAVPTSYVEIHPATAQWYGVTDGDTVRVRTRRGSFVTTARVTTKVAEGTLFVPFHWGGAERANNATRAVTDPESGIPAFKLSAATVEAAARMSP